MALKIYQKQSYQNIIYDHYIIRANNSPTGKFLACFVWSVYPTLVKRNVKTRDSVPPFPLSFCSHNNLTPFRVRGVHVIIFFYLGDCNNPLGMVNGNIHDSNIIADVASYQEDPTLFGAGRARLNSSSGYRADPKVLSQAIDEERTPFLLVHLPKEMVVSGIATQGLGQEWITKYTMYTADDAGPYKSIKVGRPYDSNPSPIYEVRTFFQTQVARPFTRLFSKNYVTEQNVN